MLSSSEKGILDPTSDDFLILFGGSKFFSDTRLNIVVLPRDFSPEGPGLARQGSASMSSMSFCVYWPKPWFAEKKSLSPIH